MEFINKIYGNAVIVLSLAGQRNVPYFDRERLSALRDYRVRKIVQYAAETVPYYVDFFIKEKISPKKIKTADDLKYLPLVNKGLIRDSGNRFISKSHLGRSSIPMMTSGSTGIPLKITHDRRSILQNVAFGERERAVIVDACGKNFGYKELEILSSGGIRSNVREFYRHNTFLPMRPKLLSFSLLTPIEELVDKINCYQPDVIRSSGSYLETFFKICNAGNIKIYLPKIIIYGSDTMTESGRKFIEDRFGVPVFSTYQAAEAFKIGFFCLERRGFHLHEDLCHVRIVDSSGTDVSDGEKGEVVISNLINRGMVILNYRLGDIASVVPGKCPCTRTFKMISQVEGRVEDIIFLPGGRFIHPREVWGVFIKRNEVLRYQLIQNEPERFLIKIATIDEDTYNRMKDGVISDLKKLLGTSALIEAQYCKGLGASPDTKFRPVVSECKKETSLC